MTRATVLAVHDHSVPVYQGLYGALRAELGLLSIDPIGRWRARWREDPSQPADLYLPPGVLARWLHGAAWRRALDGAGVAVLTHPRQLADYPWPRNLPLVYQAADDLLSFAPHEQPAELALLRRADHVFAVSAALAARLAERGGLPADRVSVLPNAVDARAIPAQAPVPRPLDGRRPLAGVLGRVSSRLRLDWLLQAVQATPWLDWVFGGDVEDGELRAEDQAALAALRSHARCRFTGRLSFGALGELARTLDVAVLPYSQRSTNPMGSPVRLFVHLPLGTPIIATPGCLQLEQEMRHLVDLCDSPQALVDALRQLHDRHYDDGGWTRRWQAAHQHTWAQRARVMAPVLMQLAQARAQPQRQAAG